MLKLMHYPMYLYVIMIILVSYYVQNDSTYTPKSKKNRVWIWMKKHIGIIVLKVYAVILNIETYMKIERKRNCEKRRNTIRRKKILMSIACTATAMKAELDKRLNVVPFDSDSAPVGVDNRCSACISYIPEDFTGDLEDSDRTVKGFAGSKTTGIKVGTL